MRTIAVSVLTASLLMGVMAVPALGTTIRDITHLQGIRENKLLAMGMVLGLKGTGDGTKNLQALRSLAAMMQKLGSNVQDLSNINADNTALVYVSVTIPENGGRDGDKVDVRLAAANGAKSLKGGWLVQCHMFGPSLSTPTSYALAEGLVSEDANLTTGMVMGGAVLEEDILPEFVSHGRITLVVDADHADLAMSSAIAKIVNDAEGEPGTPIATAVNGASVVVTVPISELADPADFISRVMSLPVLMPDRQARIIINERTGTIVITDDVEIDPVIISKAGLTIDILTPEPVGTPENPVIHSKNFLTLDPQKKASASFKDLLDAFNQLQAPMKDRIEIIRALQHTGRLHARVIEE